MKKKLLTMILAGTLAVSALTACGGSDTKTAETKTEETTKEVKEETKKEAPKEETKEEAPKAEENTEVKVEETAAEEEAEFIDGYVASDGENDLMLAFFTVGDVDMAYASDGTSEFWSQYTLEEAVTDEGNDYILINFTDVEAQMGYIDNGDGTYVLVDEQGSIYEATQLDEETINALYMDIQSGAYAADESAESTEDAQSADAQYVDGYYVQAEDGSEMILAFYTTEDAEIAYIYDGTNEAFAEYTAEEAVTDDGTEYLLLTIGDAQLGYVEDADGNVYLIDEEGNIMEATELTEEEMEGILASAA